MTWSDSDVRIALLTTETAHHAWYARALAEHYAPVLIACETDAPRPPFDAAHPFERERDAYERDVLLGGRPTRFAEIARTCQSPNINDEAVGAALRDARPDAVLVFGTTRLRAPLLSICPDRVLNLHGGDPEEYRGLDTHLWAVYHGDFEALVTTLHHVDADLDTGDIVARATVPLSHNMPLSHLRAANTRVCLELTLAALAAFERVGRFPAHRQRRRGRYYSHMPAVLKPICVDKFARYTKGLPE
ncbi:MAG: hypothetical protein D6744_05685 [Planctomycetota bacterium]|nr:MAG: hypothetical protein D6744_05685 [Planctomycetota bacterium]